MTFDRAVAEQLYNQLHAQVADGDIDPELVLDALDQLQFAWERDMRATTRIAELENECRKVGTF